MLLLTGHAVTDLYISITINIINIFTCIIITTNIINIFTCVIIIINIINVSTYTIIIIAIIAIIAIITTGHAVTDLKGLGSGIRLDIDLKRGRPLRQILIWQAGGHFQLNYFRCGECVNNLLNNIFGIFC
jgi:hypothetical protein